MTRCDLSIYVIVDPQVAERAAMPALCAAVARAGATLVQYRDKGASGRMMVETARAIGAALAGSGVPLLINDRVDVALAVGAQGVHLGQDDMHPTDARALLGPSALIGRTLKTATDIDALAGEPVDYGCIGGVFVTSHKDNVDMPLGIDGFARLRDRAATIRPDLTVGAIAGITADNAAAVIRAGADGIAVMGAVFAAADPAEASRRLAEIVSAALRARQGSRMGIPA